MPRGFTNIIYEAGRRGGSLEAPNPVAALEQRAVFLASVEEVAQLCNWSVSDISRLKAHVHNRLIEMDNLRYDVMEETEDYELAAEIWHSYAELLRKSLSLILGIKIKYV
jgi:hypothetical protein